MSVRVEKLTRLTIAALAAIVLIVPAGASAASTLSGAGSTLVAPLVAEWAQAFQAFNGVAVNYTFAGSQAGVSGVTSRAVDFGASDAPMTPSQATACGGCYQIPWALSAVGVGYHIQGVGRNLYLTGRVLAEIYLGQITHWNDARIKAINPRLRLPNLNITVIHVGTAGDTYPFTDYLSRASAAWRSKVGTGNSVSFPVGTSAGSDPSAIALLTSTNGAIAYAGAAYLIAHQLPAAAIQNAAGNYEYPNLSNIEAAAQTVKRVSSPTALDISNPPASARLAYPISTFTYVVAATNDVQKAALKEWILYAIGPGQAFGPALDFPPLPSAVSRASNALAANY